jgi:hypothetical protein
MCDTYTCQRRSRISRQRECYIRTTTAGVQLNKECLVVNLNVLGAKTN